MTKILKTKVFQEVNNFDKAYWHSRTPQERLDAALELIQNAKAIYNANPLNPPLDKNGGQIIKSTKPIERHKSFT
jgi:hypothetical protein